MEANQTQTGHNALTDDKWLAVQYDLSNYISELRDEHDVRKETSEYVVFADEHGHELNAIAEANGVDRNDLSQRMHADGRAHYDGERPGDAWSVADPIIVYKDV